MSNTITYSSELMKNYLQAEIMDPQSRFQALQTNLGFSLLFSISTDGAFYVSEEHQGKTTNGWERLDLSSAIIAADFAGNAKAKCKTFAATQDITTNKLSLGMVINDGTQDHLYLCLGNSDTDTSWTSKPTWTSVPFDATSKPSSIQIANIFFSETIDGQYIVADIIRTPESATKLISRYYLDPTNSDTVWNAHDISTDIEIDTYQSCLGRQHGQSLDGLYTMGSVNGSPQFQYQPLYNIWGGNPPSPSLFSLPGNLIPESIATCRNTDGSTELFSMAKGGLYYFASTNQKNRAVGSLVFSHSLFTGVTKLFAYKNSSTVVIWGLNQANEVFYTSCDVNQITNANAWSHPVPILSGVDLMSPYLNQADNGNTFFGVGNDTIFKMVKSPHSTIWKKQTVKLPAPKVTTPAHSFSSYTTRIQLADVDNQPVANTELLLSSDSWGHFYINNLYYVLDSTPIPVPTDNNGSITIIEAIDAVEGAKITVSEKDGSPLSINPMDTAVHKVTSLDSKEKLQGATITHSDGSTEALIDSSISDDDLKSVATANSSLNDAYTQVAAPNFTFNPNAVTLAMVGGSNTVAVDAGDLFSWLESGIEHVVDVIKDDVTGLYNFVVHIGEEVYAGVLNTVEKVAGAIKWIYNAIKTAIEKLIKFLEFLFGWNDITRTKKVIKNILSLYLKNEVQQIPVVKNDIDKALEQMVTEVNNWAGIDDWSGLGDNSTSTTSSKSNPVQDLTAAGNFLFHHFSFNVNKILHPNPSSPVTPANGLMQALSASMQKEAGVLDETIKQLSDLSKDFQSMHLEDILKRLLGILLDAAIESAQNVIDALMDVLANLAETALKVLNDEIYIPVLSDILKDFGVPSLSLLDLFCWIGAVPLTIGYKLVKDETPFPDNDDTNKLINASSWQEIMNDFSAESELLTVSESYSQSGTLELVNLSSGVTSTLFITGHALSGFLSLMSCFVTPFEAMDEDPDNAFSKPASILGVLNNVILGATGNLAPRDSIKDNVVGQVSNGISLLTIMNQAIFGNMVPGAGAMSAKIMNTLNAEDNRATSAVLDAILVLPAFYCTVYHLTEISGDPAYSKKDKDAAILYETSNLTSYLSRICYAFAVNDDDSESRGVAVGVMTVAGVITAGLQMAESEV